MRGSAGEPSPSMGMPRAARWSTAGFVSGPQSEKTTASRAVADSWVMARSGAPAGWAMSSMPGGDLVEHLGEPVEDADGERVAEGVQQPALDDDADHARSARAAATTRGGPDRHTRAASAAARTRATVSGATGPLPLKASEAVDVETPAACATARRVGRG